ncbi:MarR family winged helix-turn-helix transcriptional regulator [Marinobacterium marinum]|uniref:MarR family transcriptional regulator n=1 Tax=Marinobacterium marinum TaxID=2756129 RepID=A0A7W1WWM2_9GAMM|nr:MarR family transcriptional regulator [Marinobacterium marinum]MBA4501575.1 MarR family transcriptional regulator [Marinobacterium marinum]
MSTRRKIDMYDPLSDNFKRCEFPFYWVAQLDALYTQEMDRLLKRVDMDIPRWRIIMILKEHSELSISEIAGHAVAKLPTTTKILYRMRDEGLVLLKTSPEDGRVTLVSLTGKGLERLEEIRGSVSQLFRRSFKGLTSAQIERANTLLAKMYNNLTQGAD